MANPSGQDHFGRRLASNPSRLGKLGENLRILKLSRFSRDNSLVKNG